MAVAAGEPARSAEFAGEMLDYATATSDDETLFYALALGAMVKPESASGSKQADRLFERWKEIGGMLSSAHVLAELAPMTDRAADIGAAAALLPDGSRWRIALTAIAEGRFANAADLYREMGSKPLQAMAHLLAAEHGNRKADIDHAQTALQFYRSVGATLYANRAAKLGRASG